MTAVQVLIVEDEAHVRATVLDLLRHSGYAAAGEADGQEALRRLRAGPLPDLILLDLMLPVMDGWQFRRAQQRDPALAGIPVVVLSASPDVDLHAGALGAAGFLQKPIDCDELLELCARVARSSASR